MKKLLLLISISAFFSCSKSDEENESPNKVIKVNTTIINGVIWSSNNIDFTTYSNGDVIPQVQDYDTFKTRTTGCWRYPVDKDNNPILNAGKLYNKYVISDSRGLDVPEGYRIATYEDWRSLLVSLGGDLSGTSQVYGSYRYYYNVKPIIINGDSYWNNNLPAYQGNCDFTNLNAFGLNIIPSSYKTNSGVWSKLGNFIDRDTKKSIIITCDGIKIYDLKPITERNTGYYIRLVKL